MVILLDVDDLLNISEDQHHSGVIDN
jgi:hypothetical protein